MESKATSTGDRVLDINVGAWRGAGSPDARSAKADVEIIQASLLRTVSQLSALLMSLSITPQTLNMLPDEARYDAICLACDLANRAHGLLTNQA